jgi:hypothetical protein
MLDGARALLNSKRPALGEAPVSGRRLAAVPADKGESRRGESEAQAKGESESGGPDEGRKGKGRGSKVSR